MALNILKWRPTPGRSKVPNSGAVGEPDAHVFNCPKCARPLSDGTPRCPGCGTRLIMGVVFRRASILMGFGFIVGAFLGGVVMSLVVTTIIHPALAGVAVQPGDPAAPQSSGAVGASAAPVRPAVPATAASLSALRQMSLLDARIANDAAALTSAINSKKSAVDLATILRSVAADATIGSDMVTQVATWEDAYQFAADRQAFYHDVLTVANDGLGVSISNTTAYRASSKRMLKVLRRLPALDKASRDLAGLAQVTLPKVDLRPVGGKAAG